MHPRHPCVFCGEPTRCFVHQETASGTHGGVSICPECIRIWQLNRQARQLLMSSRGCWGGGEIRRLLRPVGTEPAERSPGAEAPSTSRTRPAAR